MKVDIEEKLYLPGQVITANFNILYF